MFWFWPNGKYIVWLIPEYKLCPSTRTWCKVYPYSQAWSPWFWTPWYSSITTEGRCPHCGPSFTRLVDGNNPIFISSSGARNLSRSLLIPSNSNVILQCPLLTVTLSYTVPLSLLMSDAGPVGLDHTALLPLHAGQRVLQTRGKLRVTIIRWEVFSPRLLYFIPPWYLLYSLLPGYLLYSLPATQFHLLDKNMMTRVNPHSQLRENNQ